MQTVKQEKGILKGISAIPDTIKKIFTLMHKRNL